jgi:hypothetical protein
VQRITCNCSLQKLTPCSWGLLLKLPVVQLLKYPPIFYGTWLFITVFRRILHWSLSWVRIIHSLSSNHISLKYILILSTHLHLSLRSGIFPSGFYTYLYAFLSSSIRAACPAHLIHLDLIILIIFDKDYKHWSFLLCSFHKPPVPSSLFGPNILLSTVFSNTLNLHSSLIIRVQVLQPYRKTDKIILLCILIFMFLLIQKWARISWILRIEKFRQFTLIH